MAEKETDVAKKLVAKRMKKRLELWKWLLENGWHRPTQPDGMNCLYPLKKMKEQVRFNFKATTLQMQVKVNATEEQLKVRPRVNRIWTILDEDTYENTSLDPDGPVFTHKEVKKTSDRKDK